MHYFITNREVLSSGKIREDGEEYAGDNLRFGRYNIDNGNFDLFPEPENSAHISYDSIDPQSVQELRGSSRFFVELYNLMITDEPITTADGKVEKTDVLFFIHGFNTDLQGVRDNIRDLQQKYVLNENSPIKHIVVFTWPGKEMGIPLHYRDDKKDAIRSGEALARGFHKLEQFFRLFLYMSKHKPCQRKIHLMVHSMGHRVLKHTLLNLEQVPEVFDQVIFMAADIEYDIFEKGAPFEKAINLGNYVHIYFHNKDRVLDISKYTKNFNNRLGRYGRRTIDPGLKDVYDYDVTDCNDDDNYGFVEDSLNHWYYYSSSEVVEDVINVFKGERSKYQIT